MTLLRIAAFSDGNSGGNPAGVMLAEQFPRDSEMQRIAAEVGYSETAFVVPHGDAFRVRYFSPESEVPFCGHATIALGAALARQYGDGHFALVLNHAQISVEGRSEGALVVAALQSPATRSALATVDLTESALQLFGYTSADLDTRLPSALIHAGADHLMFALNSRAALASMRYELDAGRAFMQRHRLVTVMLVFAESAQLFHSRNAFASGGVYEDPATGAASAAFGGYLRDLAWPHQGAIDIVQGEDMGVRSLIRAEFSSVVGSSVRVSGTARIIDA